MKMIDCPEVNGSRSPPTTPLTKPAFTPEVRVVDDVKRVLDRGSVTYLTSGEEIRRRGIESGELARTVYAIRER